MIKGARFLLNMMMHKQVLNATIFNTLWLYLRKCDWMESQNLNVFLSFFVVTARLSMGAHNKINNSVDPRLNFTARNSLDRKQQIFMQIWLRFFLLRPRFNVRSQWLS